MNGLLEVEHRSSATRAGDILRFIYTHARALEDIFTQEVEAVLGEVRIDECQFGGFVLPQQTSAFGCGLECKRLPVILVRSIAYFYIAADVIQHFGYD